MQNEKTNICPLCKKNLKEDEYCIQVITPDSWGCVQQKRKKADIIYDQSHNPNNHSLS